MALMVAGCMMSVFMLVMQFPVAVQLSNLCVTYNFKQTCGLKGSSVEFPCSYPKHLQVIQVLGWHKVYSNSKPKALNMLPAYSLRMNYLGNGNNDCTMKLTGLRRTDSSTYAFMYIFRNASGATLICKGDPGVKLHIFGSPVSVLVEQIVKGHKVPVKNETVSQGQTIMLTCVHTCTENLNANPAYIWYKGGLQLNGLSANVLSFQSISEEDMGNYACAVIGYADLPSSPFTLRVRRIPGNTMVSGHGSNKDKVPARTLCHDAQCSMQPNIDNCHTPRGMSTLSVMLIPCFCMGLLIAVMVAIQLLIAKKKKQTEIENRQSAGSVYGPPDCNSDTYEDVDIDTSSPNDKLDRVRQCLPVYENIQPAHHRF